MSLQFDEKALENLEAVERLQSDEDGNRDCLANALANRAYYAAYLALAHLAQEEGFEFTSEKGYYQHDTFPDDARGRGILDDEGVLDMRQLRDMRVKADYCADPVEREEAELVAELAQRLVRRLLR